MLTVFSILALILSRSKNSWIAFAILCLLMGIYFLISYSKIRGDKSSRNSLNWKRIGVWTFSFVIIVGSSYVYLSKGPISGLLSEDVNWHMPIEQKLDVRLPIWKFTLQMVEDFPLWGVGIGEFNFIFQKYSLAHTFSKLESFQTHNYFFQVAVELGFIGLYAFLWILGTIFIEGVHLIKGKMDFVRLGIWFGIIGFILTFFGDGYLWNIEMQLFFWLFIGLLFADRGEDMKARAPTRLLEKKRMILLSVIVILTIPFQIYERSRIFYPFERTLGLYPEELKDEGREYRWGEKVVMIPTEVKGKWVNIPIKFGNPDIKERAVKAKIFVNRELIDRLEFKDNDWHLLRYRIQNVEGPEISLKIEVSRTWNPYLTGVRYDPRELGPAIGKIYWSS